jgi:fructoselysine and glucoselysine-specific PTS system IIC component
MLVQQALLVFLVACVGYLNSFFASSLLSRPIVMGALTGLVLGDASLGIMTGATLELVWLGAIAIGASNPPDMVSGSVLGTAYVLTTGSDVAQAVALAVPISLLMSMLWNLLMMTFVPLCANKADRYADECNARGIEAMHYLATFGQTIVLAAVTAVGFFVGSSAIEALVNSIPQAITSGLDYAMGIIPALGFAMLARMIMNKRTACFLFMGFLLVAYGNLNVVGVTAIAAVVAAALVFNRSDDGTKAVEAIDDDNEF